MRDQGTNRNQKRNDSKTERILLFRRASAEDVCAYKTPALGIAIQCGFDPMQMSSVFCIAIPSPNEKCCDFHSKL
ncbi:hypothetical protein TELCIR_07020 [Teladorsagia circumcincta]|uniref:Uncharacterized protein n=1 Tax=Teladorsagia circumcincta TaxID=45464 RepID=A0A2G9UNP5_TELCI|nr:hypothetical protein TELCIR_07020 [Teladorsagia circumcincta]